MALRGDSRASRDGDRGPPPLSTRSGPVPKLVATAPARLKPARSAVGSPVETLGSGPAIAPAAATPADWPEFHGDGSGRAGVANSSNASLGPTASPRGRDCAHEGGDGWPIDSGPRGLAPLDSNQDATVWRSVGPPARSNRPGPAPAATPDEAP